MHRDVNVPDTPRFWDELEDQLRSGAGIAVHVPEVPHTPEYREALGRRLESTAPAKIGAERLPLIAIAAAATMVIALAGFLLWSPVTDGPQTAATPGVETTTTLASAVTGEELVVASFQHWVDGRTEAERVTNRLLNQGYDVVIQRLNVAEPTLNGQVLAIRHGVETTGTTVVEPRGAVTVVIGRTITAGENISG